MPEVKLKLDEKQHGGFQLIENGVKIGEMVLSISGTILTVYHTEVDEEYNGKGYAKLLLDEMTAYVREHKYTVKPLCPYVFAQFKRHPDEYADIWEK
ncbi:GNAT family N-acetyltransferase [Flavobacterium aquidurense]|uniref:Acetyltransferase-like protein n=1 Tax=Flavobacterium aquidurense TaxID=362413 RepID=A0A0Q0S3K3_9FLAO|nr:GNAT family N-acetyltransferase [Flavobacterium aquidurense]KQB40019.1 Acetyltransferase-like protein [Flavobacterium aquidurense]